jgi:hypothetical protein
LSCRKRSEKGEVKWKKKTWDYGLHSSPVI